MSSKRKIHTLLTLVSAALFIPFLGQVHLFDWDEINFAEAAREMIVTGNWTRVTIDFQPFWEKPPLFIWLQAICMKMFGVNEFAARLPNALSGIVTINLLYYWGTRFVNSRSGLLWALIYLGSLFPFFYFKTGIIDPVFNLFIVAGIIQLVQAKRSHTKQVTNYLYAGLLIGAAVLTKGPVGALVPALVFIVIWITGRFRWFFSLKQILVLFASAVIVSSVWFLPEMLRNGTGVFTNFINYQLDLLSKPVASHGQPWYYHIVVLLFGCFPASVFALPRLLGHDRNSDLDRWMLALFWVVLILFSSVTTKIVHYSSLCWFPLTYLAARQMSTVNITKPLIIFFYALIGTVVSLALIVVPWIGANRMILVEMYGARIKDVQLMAALNQHVDWTGWEWLFGAGLLMLVAVSVVWLFRNKLTDKWVIAHHLLFAVLINLVAVSVVPKVERHTQGAIIDFYKELQGKDVYVKPLHFKSYAHLFYARVMPPEPLDMVFVTRERFLNELGVKEITSLDAEKRSSFNQRMSHFLLNEELDKPAFLVVERRKLKQMKEEKHVKLFYDAGPFLVYLNR